MENASKALIMAAEILLGIMILSALVYTFNVFAEYSENTYKEIDSTQIAEFNNIFLKFNGTKQDENGIEKPIECTIHDITSLANFAQKHNTEYEVSQDRGYSENSLYVQIDLRTKVGNTLRNVEKIEKFNDSQLVNLIKQNDLKTEIDENTGKTIKKTKYYRCVECNISENTNRVNYIKFVEI